MNEVVVSKKKILSAIHEEKFLVLSELISPLSKELSVFTREIASMLPYITDSLFDSIKKNLVDRVEDLYMDEGEDVKEDVFSSSFSSIPKAMEYIKEENERQEVITRQLKEKEVEEKYVGEKDRMRPTVPFTKLPVTSKLSFLRGDIVVIGKMSNLERPLMHENFERLTMTEGIVRNMLLVGIREDYYISPAIFSVKNKDLFLWEKLRNKKIKKNKFLTVDKLAQSIYKVTPTRAMISKEAIYIKPHYYFALVPKEVFELPFSTFRMGKVIPSIAKWDILR
jgi:hypothetical protein